jgi:hypothetical protein
MTKDKDIACSNKDKPGVRAKVESAYKSWLEKFCKNCSAGNKKRKIDYKKLSGANKELMKEAVLASLGVCKPEDTLYNAHSPSLESLSPSKKPLIFVVNVKVLTLAKVSHHILPAPTISNFPHIYLQLGSMLDCPDCPVLHCVVDTAVSLITGNFHFVAALAKKYPHCIAKLDVLKDYNPIVLSGIVQRRGESVTMELTTGFQFHLPYLTRDGQAMHILIATGPQVTVNTIVGLPFIQATCMIINLFDHVADMCALDTHPFPLEYHRATVHVPIVDEAYAARVHLSNANRDLIREIKTLEQHFSAASFVANITKDNAKRMSLGSRAVGQPMSEATGNLHLAMHQKSFLGKHGLFYSPMEGYSNLNSLGGLYNDQ